MPRQRHTRRYAAMMIAIDAAADVEFDTLFSLPCRFDDAMAEGHCRRRYSLRFRQEDDISADFPCHMPAARFFEARHILMLLLRRARARAACAAR